MPGWDDSTVEKILLGAQKEGYPFQGYYYVTEGGGLKCLGRGSFSSVYQMKNESSPHRRYALKVIGLDQCLVTSEKFYSTSFLQRRLGEQTPFVIRILGICECAIALEEDAGIREIRSFDGRREKLPEGMVLLQFLLMEQQACVIEKDKFWNSHLIREELAGERGVLEFAFQVGQAILTAHQNNVLHRDIKLENIFWNAEQSCYQLGDFGIARYVEGGNAETVVYTDGYGAPEIERRLLDHYDATADIYSFGICLYLLLNDMRFPGSDGYYALQFQYDPQFVFPAPTHSYPEMTKLIRKACSYYPKDRFSGMEELLKEIDSLREKAELRNRGTDEQEEKNADEDIPADFETETYRMGDEREEKLRTLEEVPPKGESSALKDSNTVLTRFQKKKIERKKKKVLSRLRLGTMAAMIVLTGLFLWEMPWGGEQGELNFWVFPLFALTESVLLYLNKKEFYVTFGIATGIVWFFSIGAYALSAPYLFLYVALFRRKGRFGIPVSIGVLLCAALKCAFGQDMLPWSRDLLPIVLVALLLLGRLSISAQKAVLEEHSLWQVLYEEGRIDFGGNLCLVLGVLLFVCMPRDRLVNEVVFQLHFFTAGALLYLIRWILWRIAGRKQREDG